MAYCIPRCWMDVLRQQIGRVIVCRSPIQHRNRSRYCSATSRAARHDRPSGHVSADLAEGLVGREIAERAQGGSADQVSGRAPTRPDSVLRYAIVADTQRDGAWRRWHR